MSRGLFIFLKIEVINNGLGVQWHIFSSKLPDRFQIVSRFDFSRYIVFTMHLDIFMYKSQNGESTFLYHSFWNE
jgi:hypothetical protein